MRKIFIIFISFLCLAITKEAILDNIRVNGGNYGDCFRFTISGTAIENINASSNIKMKLSVGEEEKEALCSIAQTSSGQIGTYSCNLDEIISEGKVILKKVQEHNIFEISDNIEIEPLSITLKYLEARNLDFNNNYWNYDLEGETNKDISLQSLIYMDINVDNSNEIAGCLYSSKEGNKVLFKCKINFIYQDLYQKIIIPKTKSDKSSLTFNPELSENENILVWKSLNFINGYELRFNKTNNKWEFYLYVSSELPIGSKSIIDILYNSASSTATCIATYIYTLKCSADNEEQTRYDLLKINYFKSDKSTITWKDLTSIYEIPKVVQLKYTRLYDLTYVEKKWRFKILLSENTLPENALVTTDILYGSDEIESTATCTHLNQILSCIVDVQSQGISGLVQLSTVKKYGTIEWENTKKSDKIEYIISLTYKDSYNLDFIDGKWKFELKADHNVSIAKSSLVAINIKYGTEKKIGIAKCICNAYNSLYFECEADYENQSINDLILITNITKDISSSWKSSSSSDEMPITRLASLNLVKAYDLIYNKKWSFKMEVEEKLPDGTKLIADVIRTTNNYVDTATCFSSNKIISCIRDDTTQDDQEILRIRKELKSGSITWLNIKDDSVPVPLETTLSYSKSYGLFFTDVWKFIIEAISVDIYIPSGSFVIIDILQNSVETKATCYINGGNKGKISNLTCTSIASNQLKTDIIKINPNKKYSSVTWNFLTQTNNNIEIASKSSISLAFIDAYDMVFSNNTWLFTIKGKPTATIWGGDIYTIDIQYISTRGLFDSIATCWTNGGTKSDGIIFLCAADYENQSENDLVKIKYPKTDLSTVTWTTGISDNHQIVLKTSLTLVKSYDLYYDRTWKFKIDVKDGILPPGAKVIIDIYKSKDLVTTNCTSLNKNTIICETQITISSSIIKLTNETSKASSVEWKENLQNDYLCFLKVDLAFDKVYNIYYDKNDNKWKFQISKKSGNLPEGSKIIVDILYDNIPSTAICYFYSSKINCTVNETTQEKTKLVKLSHVKTEKSTVTWSNLEEDKDFYLECQLTYVKGENLRYENSKWLFDIYISNKDIPNYSNVIIDINENSYTSTADCILIGDKLNCETYFSQSTLISLRGIKSKYSTVYWENLEDIQTVSFIIKSSISYKSFGKINFSNNKYTFVVKYSDSYIPINGKVIIDILVGTLPKTSICLGNGNYELLCEIKVEDYTNPFIYISKTKTSESTITWLNLDSNKLITNIELGFYGAYGKEFVDQKFKFKILTYDNKLPNDIQISVVVKNAYIDTYKIDYEIPCISKNDILYCSVDLEDQTSNDNFELYLPKDNSRDIKWLNGNNNYVSISSEIKINFLRMNSFEYISKNKYYSFSLLIENSDIENDYSNDYIIMDISVNDENIYAKCNLENNIENQILSCFTKKIDYNINNEISIVVNKHYGNIKWNNLINDKIISDSYFGKIDKLYDLFFDIDKWKFKIKLQKIETLEKPRTLDVLISGKKGIANCQLTSGILSCEVDEENQTNSQLIKLSKVAFSGSLQLTNTENNRIPLKTSLEFNKAYNLEYNNEKKEWSFIIEAKIPENEVIPKDSYFTTDIKYQKGTTIYNEIAFCSYNNEDEEENNVIKLLCVPEKTIAKTILITINKNKSESTSITWSNVIPDSDLEMLITAELNVLEVNNLRFDTVNNIWSFQMNLGSDEYPLNSKFIIDLQYKDQEATALCTFNTGNYLLCYPEVNEQNENDFFQISYTKKSGTVTYSNIQKNLLFKVFAKLKFEKAYDLYFNENNRWEFKIKVSDSNLPNGRSTIVDVKVGYLSSTAVCSMENYILSCEVVYEYQNEFHEIKLKNSGNSEYVEWENLSYEQNIYSKVKIKYIYAYGGFSDDKWKFNIKYELISPSQLSNKMLLDIVVNNVESISICEKYFLFDYLICEATHDNQNEKDMIEIAGNETPNLGTIHWNKELTSNQKKINELKLNIKYSSISKYISDNLLYFYIEGYTNEDSDYEIIENSEIYIDVLTNKNDGNIEKVNSKCLTNNIYEYKGSNVYLTCNIENINNIEEAYINIDSNGVSKDIVFKNKKENILIYSLNNNENDNNSDNNSDNNNGNVNINNNGRTNGKPSIGKIMMMMVLVALADI